MGLEPTGSQDPYGLRRAARCVNEILLARNYDLDVEAAVRESCAINEVPGDTLTRILAFLEQRLLIQLKEKGCDHEMASLAISVIGRIPHQALRLAETLQGVRKEGWFTELAGSAVRVRNILAKAPESAQGEPREDLMAKQAEKSLWAEVRRMETPVRNFLASYNWHGLMQLLAEMSPVVSAFFDDVMVMDPDEAVRANRLALLGRCNALFREIGDLGSLKL